MLYGEPRGGRLVILLGNEEIRRGGLSALIEAITLPLRLVLGITIGAIVGFSYGLILPGMPVAEFFKAGLAFTGITPEVFSRPDARVFTSLNSGYAETFIQAPVVAERKKASILLPTTNLRFSIPSSYEIPFAVVVSDDVGGEIKLQVSSPRGVEAEITPARGVGEFSSTLRLNISQPGEYILYINATSSYGELLDVVKLKVTVDDWLAVNMLEKKVVVKPGEEAIIRFRIVKPDWLRLPSMRISVNPFNVTARLVILEGAVSRGVIEEWPVEGLVIVKVPENSMAREGEVVLLVKERGLKLFPISAADSARIIIQQN